MVKKFEIYYILA